jgi:hypothetical protein
MERHGTGACSARFSLPRPLAEYTSMQGTQLFSNDWILIFMNSDEIVDAGQSRTLNQEPQQESIYLFQVQTFRGVVYSSDI